MKDSEIVSVALPKAYAIIRLHCKISYRWCLLNGYFNFLHKGFLKTSPVSIFCAFASLTYHQNQSHHYHLYQSDQGFHRLLHLWEALPIFWEYKQTPISTMCRYYPRINRRCSVICCFQLYHAWIFNLNHYSSILLFVCHILHNYRLSISIRIALFMGKW